MEKIVTSLKNMVNLLMELILKSHAMICSVNGCPFNETKQYLTNLSPYRP